MGGETLESTLSREDIVDLLIDVGVEISQTQKARKGPADERAEFLENQSYENTIKFLNIVIEHNPLPDEFRAAIEQTDVFDEDGKPIVEYGSKRDALWNRFNEIKDKAMQNDGFFQTNYDFIVILRDQYR